MGSKFSGRAFCEQDIQIITEEVTFLIAGGYRPQDRDRVLEGLEVALDGMTLEEWRLWLYYPLGKIIDELYILGTP